MVYCLITGHKEFGNNLMLLMDISYKHPLSTGMDPQRGKEVLGEKGKECVIINRILN